MITSEDLLLKRDVPLYNNIARSGNCVGQLTARFEVYPAPKIHWEFESIGDQACEPPEVSEHVIEALVGSGIAIDRPVVTSRSLGSVTGAPRVYRQGIASSCAFGSADLRGQAARFYLPNCRFLERNVTGQGSFEQVVRVESGDEHPTERSRRSAGRFVSATLDGTWSLSLETDQEALTWLNPNQNNVGSYITTGGHIYTGSHENGPAERDEVADISIEEAMSLLVVLSLLLSFANGGYVGPLYIEVYQTREGEIVSSEMANVYRTTPLEQVGPSWITHDSDLSTYLSSFATLRRLLTIPPWSEIIDLILIWYFEAIQPMSAQARGKPWPVVASAIGAALERIGVAVVVDEFDERGLSPQERLERLLEIIGISPARGYEDTRYVERLLAIRNDATHPRPASGLSPQERDSVINRGIQWLEEVLLWRLGYQGRYLDRTARRYSSIENRYDVSSRPPT